MKRSKVCIGKERTASAEKEVPHRFTSQADELMRMHSNELMRRMSNLHIFIIPTHKEMLGLVHKLSITYHRYAGMHCKEMLGLVHKIGRNFRTAQKARFPSCFRGSRD